MVYGILCLVFGIYSHIDTIAGNSEQGQLGRVPEKFGHRGGRRGGQLLLVPDKIHSKSRGKKFKDVWAGSYNTVALTNKGEVGDADTDNIGV